MDLNFEKRPPLNEALRALGISRSSFYRTPEAYPKTVKISPRKVGMRQSDIREWVESRPAAGQEADDGEA